MRRLSNSRRGAVLMSSALVAIVSATPALAQSQRSVVAGETWTVDRPITLDALTIAPSAHVAAPADEDLTLTVDGVETPLRPGRFAGRVVLTPTAANKVTFAFGLSSVTHRFRQALYVGADGVDRARSVEAAAGRYRVAGRTIADVSIKSVGEDFNGVYVAGGDWTVRNATIDLTGNGDDDFAGFGAGFQTTGGQTRAVLDGARITVHGAVRPAIIATNGSNLIVRNSVIAAHDGTIPAGYVANVDPGKMKTVPWMLGLSGNNRATGLLGENTRATYIGSTVSSENWGVLSNDIGAHDTMTAINTSVANIGRSGYGAYSLGGATTQFFGSRLDVRDYGVIVDVGGSTVRFGASRPDVVARLNRDLSLGLTSAELRAIKPQETVVNAGRFGIFFSVSPVLPAGMTAPPPARLTITDRTIFNAGRAVFLSKGLPAEISVDGSKGAQLNSRRGVIMQVIENDDPGPRMANGSMLSDRSYREPTEAPAKVAGFDPARATRDDIKAAFSNISIRGDFFNGYRDGVGSSADRHPPAGRNLVLTFTGSRITGVISATTTRHAAATINAHNYYELGNVSNVPGAAINNGVIVTLDHSSWTPTGTSYLTALTIGPGAAITAPAAATPVMTVDGRPVPIHAGTYRGAIVVSLKRR